MTDEITAHIMVEQHPNPSVRDFHVVREVGDIDHMYGFGKDKIIFSSGGQDPGEQAKTLAKRLEALPGVTAGHMKQYEITVSIGDAFSWKDVGPLVLGEIVRTIYPEVDGGEIEISVTLGWSYYVRPSRVGFMGEDDSGHRTRYVKTVNRETVPVNLGSGRPRLDVEHLLNKESLERAKEKVASEVVYE